MDALLRHRTAAPRDWLADQTRPDLDGRRLLVETCRAELVWARADWLAVAMTAEGWQDAGLPHEATAARLVEVWGFLQPLEDRLHRAIGRLRAQRRAGWDGQPTLDDLQAYRRERHNLWRQFLAAAADYRDRRADVSCTAYAEQAAAHASLSDPSRRLYAACARAHRRQGV